MTLDLAKISFNELQSLVKKAGGQRAFAKKFGVARSTLQRHLKPLKHKPIQAPKRVGDEKNVKKCFILSSAQDSTVLNERFLDNLEAYCSWLNDRGIKSEIMIAGYTYNKSLFTDHEKKGVVWPERIKKYMRSERIRIADKIDFCAELNILPTAEAPLNKLKTYTQDRWGIVPHAKLQLISTATDKLLPAKQMMTTGTLTKPNYVQKLAGQKASFHHIYGAILVEVDTDGTFFCRQLNADDSGSFYDLDRKVERGTVSTGHRIDVLTPGDLHAPNHDEKALEAVLLGKDSVCAVLLPKRVYIHDSADFEVRNHHNIKDPHFLFSMYVKGKQSVADELRMVGKLLDTLTAKYRETTDICVVDSNHDQALLTWLKSADARFDPPNALLWHKANAACLEAIERGDGKFSILEEVLHSFNTALRVRFLKEDIDREVVNGVSHHYHGHRGPNGSMGSVSALANVSSKITIGHKHSCMILNGLYVAGTSSKLDMGYNKGPSSWSHSEVIQYANGKRAIITLMNGRWKI